MNSLEHGVEGMGLGGRKSEKGERRKVTEERMPKTGDRKKEKVKWRIAKKGSK